VATVSTARIDPELCVFTFKEMLHYPGAFVLQVTGQQAGTSDSRRSATNSKNFFKCHKNPGYQDLVVEEPLRRCPIRK
jgi:hypothetical protein